MSKTVLVKVVERKNPTKLTEPGKFYASAVTTGEKNIEELAEEIESSCTVTSQDIVAVIEALRKRIIIGLQNGEIMRLGNIGYFRLSIGSMGAAKKEDFNVNCIKRAKILFTPCSTLKDMLKTLNFEISKGASTAESKDAGNGSTGNESGGSTGGNSGSTGNEGGSTGGDDMPGA